MASMNQISPAFAAATDLGVQAPATDAPIGETEEQRKRRLSKAPDPATMPMAIISPAVEALLGKGLNG